MNIEPAILDIDMRGQQARRTSQRLARDFVRKRLRRVNDLSLSVSDPWGTWSIGGASREPGNLRVHSGRFYVDLMLEGGIGAARSYMAGDWDTDDLSALFGAFLTDAEALNVFQSGFSLPAGLVRAAQHFRRRNSLSGSRRNIHAHYDLGNDFFRSFLDETMTYSCGIFERSDSTLAQASEAKLERICRKLALQPRDHVLEIGSGWGSFAMHAARNYGCRVTTTTISQQQFDAARERIQCAGLEDRIEVVLQDYRELKGQYDKLASIEMIEAVGHGHLAGFFAQCASLLKTDGLMALQVITMPEQSYQDYLKRADFIQTFIFPGSCCPAPSALLEAATVVNPFRCEHLEDIGVHYAETLRRWRQRFHENVDQIRALGYSQQFIRMWHYYLCYCEAGFAARYLGDLQVLLRRPNTPAPGGQGGRS